MTIREQNFHSQVREYTVRAAPLTAMWVPVPPPPKPGPIVAPSGSRLPAACPDPVVSVSPNFRGLPAFSPPPNLGVCSAS